ncbi:hypothetical protein G5T42_16380 [Microbacterium sp. 4R-513]|uniref:clostripain-related cysteine peptidase n=1 Tax=Microbacterium sp. 4R-513 TaxID=2567934 RepID=UPI0013E12E01|nr:clostripain-related cysteine peptidase [Microbacterium sp. 4R-513]QIG40855.1 hypothetical protein G5T42_16380 [Microbacterium sp. 4R-513]
MGKRSWIISVVLLAVVAVVVVALVVTGAGASTVAAAGAEDETSADWPVATGDRPEASWTFMAYVMGDTDLEPYALDDLTEMASVGSDENVNIVAMVDRNPDYSADGLANLDDWEDTKFLQVDDGEFTELADLGELDTGEATTLADFIEASVTEYPAEHYALMLWDHGGGWLGMGADKTNGEDALELDEIAQGVDEGLSAAGVDRIDLLGFDACLMATYEVASTLAPYADYLVASEEVEPGHGWNYESLGILADDPQTTAPDLADAIIEGFNAQAEQEETSADVTLGLIDLGAIADLDAAMSDVADAFTADPGAYSPDLARAQQGVVSFGRDADPEASFYQIDLGEFLDNLAANGGDDLAAAAATARAALDASVLRHTEGPARAGSTGMSIYFPPIEDYFYQSYRDLQDVPVWPATLSEFYRSGATLNAASLARFHDEDEPTVSFGDDGLSVFAPMTDTAVESLTDATVSIGYEEDGELVYVAQMPALPTEQDGVQGIQADYDLTYLDISDGTEEALVYQNVTTDLDTGYTVIDIPMDYVAPDADDPSTEYQDAVLTLVLDDDGTIIQENLYGRDESGALGALDPDPDGLLYPIALISTEDDDWVYERTHVNGLKADVEALQYVVEDMPPGVVLTLDLSVWDYSGNGDYATVTVEVPG